jgi:hypothetical protein
VFYTEVDSHRLMLTKSKTLYVNTKFEILCGDGFVDFIHRPKSKILKILKKLKSQGSEAGSASVLR